MRRKPVAASSAAMVASTSFFVVHGSMRAWFLNHSWKTFFKMAQHGKNFGMMSTMEGSKGAHQMMLSTWSPVFVGQDPKSNTASLGRVSKSWVRAAGSNLSEGVFWGGDVVIFLHRLVGLTGVASIGDML